MLWLQLQCQKSSGYLNMIDFFIFIFLNLIFFFLKLAHFFCCYNGCHFRVEQMHVKRWSFEDIPTAAAKKKSFSSIVKTSAVWYITHFSGLAIVTGHDWLYLQSTSIQPTGARCSGIFLGCVASQRHEGLKGQGKCPLHSEIDGKMTTALTTCCFNH